MSAGLLAVIVGAFAWLVHGLMTGIVSFVVTIAIYIALNLFVMSGVMGGSATASDRALNDFLRPFRWVRWGVFILAMAVVALTGAEVVTL